VISLRDVELMQIFIEMFSFYRGGWRSKSWFGMLERIEDSSFDSGL
jgi:hypothetical protein